MTPEETVKDLQKIMKLKFTGTNVPASMNEAIRVLKFSIERKPDEDCLCPQCGADLIFDRGCGIEYNCKFCPECGQAIKWRVKE